MHITAYIPSLYDLHDLQRDWLQDPENARFASATRSTIETLHEGVATGELMIICTNVDGRPGTLTILRDLRPLVKTAWKIVTSWVRKENMPEYEDRERFRRQAANLTYNVAARKGYNILFAATRHDNVEALRWVINNGSHMAGAVPNFVDGETYHIFYRPAPNTEFAAEAMRQAGEFAAKNQSAAGRNSPNPQGVS